ncbi:Hypothetical predicted protein [Pelobates cultripes]|uniref:Helix-turn-helix domain-containing protein n=1 Tax=Pelobates cultripes TaxID=61616 RepID=A0AAD1RE83_PELCU|nr:Hypothetical predicted protein [Pelobates cultripes]
MAPMYANAFMYENETQHILSCYNHQITRYFRLIDDILILWNGSKEEALQFVHALNNLTTQVKMTATIDEHSVQFLDLEIMMANQKLEYKRFSKPTDRNTILHFQSFHPKHLKQSLPYSQFLRVFRNNSLSEQRDQQLLLMYGKFQARGYPWTVLDQALAKAKTTYSSPSSQPQRTVNIRPIFPMLFNTASSKLTSSVRNNWKTLELDLSIPEIFQQKPMFSYRCNKNLKDLLVNTDPHHCYSPVKKNIYKCRMCKVFGVCDVRSHYPFQNLFPSLHRQAI